MDVGEKSIMRDTRTKTPTFNGSKLAKREYGMKDLDRQEVLIMKQ